MVERTINSGIQEIELAAAVLGQRGIEGKWLEDGSTARRIGAGSRNPLVLSGLVLAGANRTDTPEITAKLDALLDRVKADDSARQEFVDLLEVLGPDHPRTAEYRRALTARIY